MSVLTAFIDTREAQVEVVVAVLPRLVLNRPAEEVPEDMAVEALLLLERSPWDSSSSHSLASSRRLANSHRTASDSKISHKHSSEPDSLSKDSHSSRVPVADPHRAHSRRVAVAA